MSDKFILKGSMDYCTPPQEIELVDLGRVLQLRVVGCLCPNILYIEKDTGRIYRNRNCRASGLELDSDGGVVIR